MRDLQLLGVKVWGESRRVGFGRGGFQEFLTTFCSISPCSSFSMGSGFRSKLVYIEIRELVVPRVLEILSLENQVLKEQFELFTYLALEEKVALAQRVARRQRATESASSLSNINNNINININNLLIIINININNTMNIMNINMPLGPQRGAKGLSGLRLRFERLRLGSEAQGRSWSKHTCPAGRTPP